VAVVSPNPVTRAGLTALLAEHPDRVAVFDVASHDGHLGGHDVAIYDLAGLADPTGLADLGRPGDLAHLIRSGGPVVALMPLARLDLGERAVAAGVADVLALDITGIGLVEALEHAAAGRSPAPAQREQDRQVILATRYGLTPREAQVLMLIATGLSNHEIADQMYLSVNSVKTYIRSAYKKIGATSRSQAVLWVYQHDHGGIPLKSST
jgi:DNA-binding NarL/FixJ family response regulator